MTPNPTTRAILERLFDRVEAAHLNSQSRTRNGTPSRFSPITRDAWPWPGSRLVASGDDTAVRGWFATAADLAMRDGEQVLIAGPMDQTEELIETMVAHAGLPLDRMRTGAMSATDWPTLSRRLGLIASHVVVDEDVELLVSSWSRTLTRGDDGAVLEIDGRAVSDGGVTVAGWDAAHEAIVPLPG